jgi:hypothetical protein
MADIPSKNTFHQKPKRHGEKRELQKYKERQPSSDFATLIDAIKSEGRAHRKEEQREDQGKKLREWITIIVIGLTFIAICYQVHEMIKVYEPIKAQAEAAKIAADATKRAADAATKQSEIATRQSDNSDKALLQAQRAWVGPRDARLEGKPVPGQKNKFIVEYQNTGKEPALAFFFEASPLITTVAEDMNGVLTTRMMIALQKCLATPARILAGVVFPTSGFNSNALNIAVDEKLIDDDVATGAKILVVNGCFAYQTGNVTHHSAFCYFYRADESDITHLNICTAGNYAD